MLFIVLSEISNDKSKEWWPASAFHISLFPLYLTWDMCSEGWPREESELDKINSEKKKGEEGEE